MAVWKYLYKSETNEYAGGGYLKSAPDGFYLSDDPPGEETPRYAPKPFEERIRDAFEALPVNLQKKYKAEIKDAAFFLERGNLPMVLEAIKDAEAKNPEPEVRAIIEAAKAELGA